MKSTVMLGLATLMLSACGLTELDSDKGTGEQGITGTNNGNGEDVTPGNTNGSTSGGTNGSTNGGTDTGPDVLAEDPQPLLREILVSGTIEIQDPTVSVDQISLGLKWMVDDGARPREGASSPIEDLEGDLEFAGYARLRPPELAMTINESNQRDGLGVAYLIAFIDQNGNGLLDCVDTENCDTMVGASPNTLVLFGDPKRLIDHQPLFAFNDDPGIIPQTGWSLIHLTSRGCEPRPKARDWESTDTTRVVVIGDFRDKGRCQTRNIVQPDID